MCAAWLFGDKVLDHDFCDMVIDNLLSHALSTKNLPAASLFRLYQVCAPNIPARQLLVDMYVYVANPGWFDNGDRVLSEEAYRNITVALIARKGMQSNMANAPWLADCCRYHWHKKDGGTCYKDKAHWAEHKR